MQLGIGTAQFGLDYGISNQKGQTGEPEVEKILDFSSQHNISLLDTSPGYGNSEKVLGKYFKDTFKIVTKLPYIPDSLSKEQTEAFLESELEKSLNNLGTSSLRGLLIHNASQLKIPQTNEILKFLSKKKDEGLVEKIGISVYNKEDIDLACKLFSPEIVQAPINILDQRLVLDGSLKKLKDKNCEIHARSIFLQGLLLLNKTPDKLLEHDVFLSSFRKWCEDKGMSALESCLNFIKGVKECDYVICGVESSAQLEQLHTLYTSTTALSSSEFRDISCDEPRLLDPSSWN